MNGKVGVSMTCLRVYHSWQTKIRKFQPNNPSVRVTLVSSALPPAMSSTIVKYGLLPVKRTVFLLCDVQEKFRTAVKYFDEIVQSSCKLLKASKILDIPVIVTEQYPQGLGKTASELDINHAEGVFQKTKFSMLIPEVVAKLDTLCDGNVQCAVLFGLEAHVCIEQTAAELCAHGVKVHVVADACSSRTQEDRLLAFERLRQIGCFVTTSESVLFKLLGDKENPKFGEIRDIVKTAIRPTGMSHANPGES